MVRTLTCQAKYDRQPIVTQDGGTVALDWFQPRGLDKIPSDAPIVLVLHGLTGNYHTFEPTPQCLQWWNTTLHPSPLHTCHQMQAYASVHIHQAGYPKSSQVPSQCSDSFVSSFRCGRLSLLHQSVAAAYSLPGCSGH